jgi:hypothetical protein
MQYNFRHPICPKGQDGKDMLSGVQKYIRRGMLDMALYCTMEVGEFMRLPEAKALVTNFVNRLRVILVEDTAWLTSTESVLMFNQHYYEFEENRAKDAPASWAALINMVIVLTKMKKQRLCSYIKAVYFTPDAKKYALASGDAAFVSLYPPEYTIDAQVAANPYPLKSGDNVAVLRPIVNGLLTAMKRRSDHGFYWLHQLVLALENGVEVAPRKLTTAMRASPHPIYLLFELCYMYADRGATLWDANAETVDLRWKDRMHCVLDVCADYYKHFGLEKKGAKGSHRDWLLFTMWPLLYCVRDVDWDANKPLFVPIKSDAAETMHLEHVQAPRKELDDFVFDQHTARGRSLKRKGDFFALVGAVIANEDLTIAMPVERRLYESFKVYQVKQEEDDKEVREDERKKKSKTN